MGNTTARIRKGNKHFEIVVDMDLALKYKKGLSSSVDFLEMDKIFTDLKKGEHASSAELKNAFNSDDVYEVAGKIVKEGDVLVTQEQRSHEQEQRFKQVIDFISRNAVDPKTGNPHTPERIKNALDEAHVVIKNIPVEGQIKEILESISRLIPIKMSMKRVKITIPSMYTGHAYGIIAQYKESEDWLGNGDLQVTVNVPAGMVMSFYDKLNSTTHGSALTEEIKE